MARLLPIRRVLLHEMQARATRLFLTVKKVILQFLYCLIRQKVLCLEYKHCVVQGLLVARTCANINDPTRLVSFVFGVMHGELL